MPGNTRPSPQPSIAAPGPVAALVACLLFVCVAPTLTWLEFSSGSENLVAATVLEMHAGGPWLVPNLNRQPRVRKPPLPAWVAAALVPQSVIAQLDSTDSLVRNAAYRRLAWSLRWPPLLFSCLIVLATYEMGRTMVDARFGLVACAVCASSLLLLRYGRSATSDIHLALWVTFANLCLIKSWFTPRRCLWLILSGVAAGLALMSKGPVGLIQSAFPFATFVLVRWWLNGRRPSSEFDADGSGLATSAAASHRPWLLAITAGFAAFLIVAAPWFLHVLQTVPQAWELWRIEVTRDGATTLQADPPLSYFVVFPMLLPWTVFLVAGLIDCTRRWKQSPAMHLSLLMLVLPLIVMSLVKDKNERYLLPMVSAGALIAAFAIVPQLKSMAEQSSVDRLLRRLHIGLLWVIAIGLPVMGAIASLKPGGEAWWGWGVTGGAAAGMAAFPFLLHALYLRRRWMLVALSAGLMLAAHALFLSGYRTSMNGRSEMKALADEIRLKQPAAEVFYVDRRASPKAMPQDLQIYLNRVVTTIYGPQAILPDPAPGRVLVMLQREEEPVPEPAGWRSLARQPWGFRTWHALAAD